MMRVKRPKEALVTELAAIAVVSQKKIKKK